MAFVLDPSAEVAEELRRAITERLDAAIATLDGIEGASPSEVEEAVHSVRKRCKEVRGAARLVRAELGAEFDRFNHKVRRAAESLAPIRDAHAVLATFDDLRVTRNGHDRDLARVRAGQAEVADLATLRVHGGDPRIGRARRRLVSARKSLRTWDLPPGFEPLADGLEVTYRRGRTARRTAMRNPTDDNLHEWRKSVKILWYQIRLIERAAPSVLHPLASAFDDLAEALGDDHDLAVLVERLDDDPKRFGGKRRVKHAIRLARSQQDDLRRRAFRLGATLYAERPRAFRQRMESYWANAVTAGPELQTGGIAELAADEWRVAERAEPVSTAERERKFHVVDLPDLGDEGERLRQGYLAIDGSVSVRVRDAATKGCTMTVKAGRGAVRTELEFPIDIVQFDAAWEHTAGRRIHKTRHRLPLGDHVVELDMFHDDLDGLVLVEVEFGSDEELASFEPPDWFGREVTDDEGYTNASLAVAGDPHRETVAGSSYRPVVGRPPS